MNKILIGLSFLVMSCGSGSSSPFAPSCQTGQLLGYDNQCYSCNTGTPEYASGEFGYCSSINSGGVTCCSTEFWNYNNITCEPRTPWLCSDALCHSSNIGVCVYLP